MRLELRLDTIAVKSKVKQYKGDMPQSFKANTGETTSEEKFVQAYVLLSGHE